MNRIGGKLLALLLLLLTAGAGITLLVAPVLTVSRGYDESIADLRFRLDRYQRSADRVPRLKARLAQLQRQQGTGEELLQGDSSAIAGAALQERLKEIVQDAGGRLESTQLLTTSADGAMERLTARARFSGSVEVLQKALYRIEYGRPLLLVEKAGIRRSKQRRLPFRRSREGRPPEQGPDRLRVTLEVAGYRRRGKE